MTQVAKRFGTCGRELVATAGPRDGRVELFLVGNDDNLWHRTHHQVCASAGARRAGRVLLYC